MMEGAGSFSARRQAHGLPSFSVSLPPPTENIPSTQRPLHSDSNHPQHASSSSYPQARASASVLTPTPGVTSDGLSPSLSSVNTTSSQASSASAGLNQYYGGHVHGQWPTPNSNSSYTFSASNHGQATLTQPGYGPRGMYSPSPTGHYNQRNSHSPATGGEGLPHPPFDHHQPFQTPIPGGGGPGHGTPSLPSQIQPPQIAILNSQDPPSSQAPSTANSTAQVDHYAHSRPPTTPSYYTGTSTPQQPAFPAAYAPHPSPTHPPPSTSAAAPRTLPSTSGMAAPQPYHAYRTHSQPYQMSPMGGPIMSNISNPNGQMSLVHSSMSMAAGYGHLPHPGMYGHGPQQVNQERPFKCDQCQQSFNRNHDLKRHKRIHLAVKPFPCTFCEKSFSRKDALKRHRLVKGCDSSNRTAASNHTNSQADSKIKGEHSNDGSLNRLQDGSSIDEAMKDAPKLV